MSEVNSFLEHHGVRGMKWGVHRTKSSGNAKLSRRETVKRNASLPMHENYTTRKYNNDKRIYGKKGADQVNADLHEGKTLKEARAKADHVLQKTYNRKATLFGAAALGVIYGPTIADMAVRSLNSALIAKKVSNGQKFAAAQAASKFSDTHGIANYQTVKMHFDAASGVWA